jgi:dynein heavy chain
MEEAWKTLEFQTLPYKETGTCVLCQLGDIVQLMDDQLVSTQNMAVNSYIAILEPKWRAWEELLVMLRTTIGSWLHCQVSSMYLEPIFASPDIQKQLPGESKRFQGVDTMWKTVMARVTKTPRILPLIKREKNNLLIQFDNANKELESVQKNLDAYLERKRQAFPRFYFLSDEDLLQILAKTKEPTAVQPHLRNCFDGISKLTFEGEGEKCLVHAMTSAENETVKFDKTVLAQGAVEAWLLQVEAMMRLSIRKLIQDSLTTYNQHPREAWVLKSPAQIIHAVNSIMWTRQVADALKRDLTGLQQLETKLIRVIENIVNLAGSSGKPARRKKPKKKPVKVRSPSAEDGEEVADPTEDDGW